VALFVTGTSLSIPALMGLIMVVGVSTANSVLVTSFARDLWQTGVPGAQAAVEAAATRLRPVSMTALAMILACCRWRWVTAKAASKTPRWAAP